MRFRHRRGWRSIRRAAPPLSDRAEDLLERLWVLTEEEGGHAAPGMVRDDEAFERLRELGLVTLSEDGVRLTPEGHEEARHCIRRHRLAERLVADILDSGESDTHEAGCKFEHGLHRGLEDRVCTLLGHPRTCPHGKPIPPGECCRQMERHAGPLLTTAADLGTGEPGVIAYLHSENPEDLRKLMAIGALPGATIVVRQRFPSYLVEVGESQFGIDEHMARQIYVRHTAG